MVVVGGGWAAIKGPVKALQEFPSLPPLPPLFGYERKLQGEFSFPLPLLLPFLVIVYLRHHLLWLSVFNLVKEPGPPVLIRGDTAEGWTVTFPSYLPGGRSCASSHFKPLRIQGGGY